MNSKKRIFSGVQPSGNLHIGNYLGAIANWVKLQDEFDSIFCVVDMHAITVQQDPEELRKKTIEIAKIYLAAGIDPKKSSIFIQSQVSEHAELCWILNTIVKNGELAKMTQFKVKTGIFDELSESESSKEVKEKANEIGGVESEKNAKYAAFQLAKKIFEIYKKEFNDAGTGLFDYPVLMAADILLYGTDVVPVGEDQKQHVELARDLAKRFNQKFGETFVVPESRIKKEGMRVMGLDNPEKKMSKSAESVYNRIELLDSAEIIRKKIKKAVTDSGSEIVYSDEKPALKNLINIYAAFSEKTPKEIESIYAGKGYGDFKTDLAEIIVGFLTPFQERYAAISDQEVLEILRAGKEKVQTLAKAKLDEVKTKIGFIV
ncbi:MAG: tryptophan--tRNA ligase [Candidatus Moranbacteria bacterium]|nr:tryptophan--tRNA ligase [Candidatus Moranbacteria bacterium]